MYQCHFQVIISTINIKKTDCDSSKIFMRYVFKIMNEAEMKINIL